MKKLYLLLILGVTTQLSAQIQITQANMPSINDTVRYSVAGSGTLNFTQNGANYFWDYRNLSIASQDVYKFQALLSTPYKTLAFTGMPVGAIGYKIADSIGQGQAAIKNLYNFYDSKSSGWSAVGTGFTLAALPLPAGGVYSDKDEIFLFPLKYNNFDSTTFFVKTPLGPIVFPLGNLTQKGYRLTKVEGWGIISTPYGDSIPCLKIKSTIIETDSLKLTTPALNIGFQANRVEYKWLSTSEKIPVLEVTGTEIGGNFTATNIRYRDNYRVPGPNPFGPKPRFTVDKTNGKVSTDTFRLNNQTVLLQGTSFVWNVTPNKGVRYVLGSNSNSQNPILVFDSIGVYSITLTASNFTGSNDTTANNLITITKDNQQGIKTFTQNGISLYPNPVQNTIYLQDPSLIGSVGRIFDNSGKLVLEFIVNDTLNIPSASLCSGHYTLLLIKSQNITYTQFIKE